jgi:hypothetical protein
MKAADYLEELNDLGRYHECGTWTLRMVRTMCAFAEEYHDNERQMGQQAYRDTQTKANPHAK